MEKKPKIKGISVYAAMFVLGGTLLASNITKKEQAKYLIVKNVLSGSAMLGDDIDLIGDDARKEINLIKRFQESMELSNLDNIDVLKNLKQGTIVWDSQSKLYRLVCSNDDQSLICSFRSDDADLMLYTLRKTNCEKINLYNIESTSILEGLQQLSHLKGLILTDSPISNLDSLKNLTSLEGIRIDNCPNVDNITFFEYLPNITEVELVGTKSSDLTPLSKCKKLKIASLRCNEFTNPEVLNDLENLETVCLEYNKIADIETLNGLVSRGIISKEQAVGFSETTTNHDLIFKSEEEGIYLSIKYLDAKGEYYAIARNENGTVIAYSLSKDLYSFYDISESVSAPTYLTISNFPEDSYIHHLKNKDDYTVVSFENCDFNSISIPSNTEFLSIKNCPNLRGTLSIHSAWRQAKLRYIDIENTGIDKVDFPLKNVETAILINNNFENYDFLLNSKKLTYANVSLDYEDFDYRAIYELINNGVNVEIHTNTKQDEFKTPQESEENLNNASRILK